MNPPIEISATVPVGEFRSPLLPPGTEPPPGDSLVDIDCEDEGALMESWFAMEGDESGVPPPGAIITTVSKDHPFHGTVSEIGFSLLTPRLFVRNVGSKTGFWVLTLHIEN